MLAYSGEFKAKLYLKEKKRFSANISELSEEESILKYRYEIIKEIRQKVENENVDFDQIDLVRQYYINKRNGCLTF